MLEPVELLEGMDVTIDEEKYTGSIPVEVFNGASKVSIVTGQNTATRIETISHVDSCNNSGWYTLNGIRLNDKPTSAGIYIHGGRKVIVR